MKLVNAAVYSLTQLNIGSACMLSVVMLCSEALLDLELSHMISISVNFSMTPHSTHHFWPVLWRWSWQRMEVCPVICLQINNILVLKIAVLYPTVVRHVVIILFASQD